MTFKERLFNFIAQIVMERPAKRQGFDKIYGKLESNASSLAERFSGAANDDKNANKLRHIIAIERWGQSRLEVLLGAEFQEDDNHAYQPESDRSWDQLQDDFNTTRAGTLTLLNNIKALDINSCDSVKHNQFGPMSALAWMHYLNFHSAVEAKAIK